MLTILEIVELEPVEEASILKGLSWNTTTGTSKWLYNQKCNSIL